MLAACRPVERAAHGEHRVADLLAVKTPPARLPEPVVVRIDLRVLGRTFARHLVAAGAED